MIDLTPLISAVIAVLAVIITVYLVPWLKSRTTAQERQEINAWVKIAVQAAEQIYKGSGKGAEKKQFVLDYLQDKGFTVDLSTIDKMIEACVLELNKGVL